MLKACVAGRRVGGGSVDVGQTLWTDRAVLERHSHAVPFLNRRSWRHEAQLGAERRRVLYAEVDLDWREVELGPRNEHRPQLPLHRLDDARAHPRRRQFAVD